MTFVSYQKMGGFNPPETLRISKIILSKFDGIIEGPKFFANAFGHAGDAFTWICILNPDPYVKNVERLTCQIKVTTFGIAFDLFRIFTFRTVDNGHTAETDRIGIETGGPLIQRDAGTFETFGKVDPLSEQSCHGGVP